MHEDNWCAITLYPQIHTSASYTQAWKLNSGGQTLHLVYPLSTPVPPPTTRLPWLHWKLLISVNILLAITQAYLPTMSVLVNYSFKARGKCCCISSHVRQCLAALLDISQQSSCINIGFVTVNYPMKLCRRSFPNNHVYGSSPLILFFWAHITK